MPNPSKSSSQVHKKIVRFDPAPSPGVDLSAQRRGVLEMFRAWIRTAPSERRLATRHEAGGGKLWLGWWDSDQLFTAVNVELVNISRGGALVRATESPQELREIWVCLDALDTSDCVPASVLEVEPVRRGVWLVRLEFGELCPHSFLAATLARPEAQGKDGPAGQARYPISESS